jgi:predicted TPR repeat methyltransferase
MAEERQLDAVYAAKSVEEIARTYDDWAESYDGEMARVGYRHPAICLALLARHLPRGAGPVLDAGAGTGLIGEWLEILGFPAAEALDVSEGMLAVARCSLA